MDRRSYPRFPVLAPVRVSVDVLGAELLAENPSSSGTTRDVSRSGLAAEVDHLLAVGTDCSVSLLGVEGLVRPSRVRGRVRHAARSGDRWRIGIEFETLVDVTDEPGPLVA